MYVRCVRKFVSRCWVEGTSSLFLCFLFERISCLGFEMRNDGCISREIGFCESLKFYAQIGCDLESRDSTTLEAFKFVSSSILIQF